MTSSDERGPDETLRRRKAETDRVRGDPMGSFLDLTPCAQQLSCVLVNWLSEIDAVCCAPRADVTECRERGCRPWDDPRVLRYPKPGRRTLAFSQLVG